MADSSGFSWGSAAAGAIPVVGGIISGLINSSNTADQNSQNRQFAAAQQAQQNAYNLDMWNKTNAYNSPDAQMARFKAAGLNPNLIYGQSNVASMPAPSAPANYHAEKPNVPDYASVGAQAVNAINSSSVTGAQVSNLATQSALNVAQSALDALNGNKVAAETDNIVRKTPAEVANLYADTDLKTAQMTTTLSANERAAALQAPTYAAALQNVLNLRDVDREIQARIIDTIGSAAIKQADVALRAAGANEHDSLLFRMIGIGLQKAGFNATTGKVVPGSMYDMNPFKN